MELKRQVNDIANDTQKLVLQLKNEAFTVDVGANQFNSLASRLHALAARLK